jgi:biotin transport system substrate-specific component
LANLVGGVVVLNILGVIGMMARADLSLTAATSAALVFVPGDVLKAVCCALVARGVHAASPGRLPQRRRRLRDEPADVST